MKNINLKSIRNFTIIALLIPLCWSCENPIEFSGDDTASLMVVNCLLTPDSVIKVQVTRSKFFLKDNSTFANVDNATVKLFVNDTLYEQLSSIGNGFYTGVYLPNPGDKVKITSRSPAYEEVSAMSEVVKPAIVTQIDTISLKTEKEPIIWSVGSFDGDGFVSVDDTVGYNYRKQMDIRLFIQDEAKVKNYYRVNLSLKQFYDNDEITEREYFFSSKDLVFGSVDESGIFGEGYSQSQYNEFSDEIFDGKSYGLKFSTNFYNAFYKDNGNPKPDVDATPKLVRNELVIQLHSVSESYYKYLKTKSVGTEGFEMFSEPVQIFSNVKGGIGVLGSYAIKRYSIEIPLEYIGTEGYGGSGGYGGY